MVMRSCRTATVLGLVAMLVLVACGPDTRPVAGNGNASSSSSAPQKYAIDATVLESAEHGPELCAGPVAASLPPLCGGPPIPGWDWNAVAKKTTAQTTTWGEYHLVGTYDGTTFTLTEPASEFQQSAPVPLPDFWTPCAAPAGGWSVVDPAKISLDDYTAFTTEAPSPPDYAGMWVDASTNVNGLAGVPINQVYTVAYTGDLDRHRSELAAIWGGPVCVIQRSRTEASLRAITDELFGDFGRSIGLQVLSSGNNDLRNTVMCTAMVSTPALQQKLDERFGTGVVELTGALQPVP